MEKRLGSLRIALFGSGAQAQRWAWALAEHASLDSGSFDRADAVVLAPGAQEPVTGAREALANGLPVLLACCQASQLQELASLCDSAAPQRAFLHVYEPFLHQGAFGLARRFVGGPEPFWRPLYLRQVAGQSGKGPERLEDRAIQALATIQTLLDAQAEQVTAEAVRESDGEPCALFLTVRYVEGLLLRSMVSLAEARDELVVVTHDRRLMLEGDQLRIAPYGTRGSGRERLLSRPAVDPIAEEAKRFVEAVASHDASAANSDRWLRVAELWSATRRSLSQGGPIWVQAPAVSEVGTPPFRLLQGGAPARIGSSHGLTLVAG